MGIREDVELRICEILDEPLVIADMARKILETIPEIAVISCLQCPRCGIMISEEDVKCQLKDKPHGEEI